MIFSQNGWPYKRGTSVVSVIFSQNGWPYKRGTSVVNVILSQNGWPYKRGTSVVSVIFSQFQTLNTNFCIFYYIEKYSQVAWVDKEQNQIIITVGLFPLTWTDVLQSYLDLKQSANSVNSVRKKKLYCSFKIKLYQRNISFSKFALYTIFYPTMSLLKIE